MKTQKPLQSWPFRQPSRPSLGSTWVKLSYVRRFTFESQFSNPGQKLLRYDPRLFRVTHEIEEAISSRKPVVALETTIYTHGFPYPDNVALASHLESVVRLNGGVPATIGVLNGIARVGLGAEEIIQLASAAGRPETMKVSRRDLPYITGLGIAGRKVHGGTTVAGTMVLAKMSGIQVFGTGGLGGVHRGGQDTMDISADLTELGRTAVAVVSSGCKSFLDIPRTLEYLETQGVGVATFADGRTGEIDLPAFWTRESGVKSPTIVHDEKEAAAIIYARRSLNLESGLLFANPIPQEYSIPRSEMDGTIEAAVREAEEKGFFGHANTPFILARIKELTGGKSIPANRALIESNVARATRVAVELSKLESTGSSGNKETSVVSTVRPIRCGTSTKLETPVIDQSTTSVQSSNKIDILVAGSVAIDLSCDYTPFETSSNQSPKRYTSNPAAISQSIGGVGHNVAIAAHLINGQASVQLCSLVADDLAGGLILSALNDRGLNIKAIKVLETDNQTRTAQYVAVNKTNKDLEVAMADMNIVDTPRDDFSSVWQPIIDAAEPKWIVVDANWDAPKLKEWFVAAKSAGANVAFEPVSVAKASRLFPPVTGLSSGLNVFPAHEIDLATPNEQELAAMHTAAKTCGYFEQLNWWQVIDALGIPSSGARNRFVALTDTKLADQGVPQQTIQLLPFIPTIVTKLGAEGVLVTMLLDVDDWRLASPATAPYILSKGAEGNSHVGGVYMRLFTAAEKVEIEDLVSVNGVGDTFLGALVAGLAKGIKLDERLIEVAQKAAVLTLKSMEAVSPRVSDLASELEALRSPKCVT